MSVIKSLVIAFSMYSKIPMPHLELEEKDMRYVMGFFPLVGAVTGLIMYGLYKISGYLYVPYISVSLILMILQKKLASYLIYNQPVISILA